MSSAVCSIPLISPIGVCSQLHVADQFPPPRLQYSTVSICMCVRVLVRLYMHISTEAGQTSHRHVTRSSISQRPEKKIKWRYINIKGNSISWVSTHFEKKKKKTLYGCSVCITDSCNYCEAPVLSYIVSPMWTWNCGLFFLAASSLRWCLCWTCAVYSAVKQSIQLYNWAKAENHKSSKHLWSEGLMHIVPALIHIQQTFHWTLASVEFLPG